MGLSKSECGWMGGKSKSPAKIAASKLNGRKGGRPRKDQPTKMESWDCPACEGKMTRIKSRPHILKCADCLASMSVKGVQN
jgi:hypothetical protein